MAPSITPSKHHTSQDDDDLFGIKGDRKARKPLVEKKRRARINESLQELRHILSDSEFQSKMENAEVLELTVKRVQAILRGRASAADKMHREASERFAAGYIQCMHEVHTFVSSCPGIDATVAAELLNHLLESMPLNEGSFQDMLVDLISDVANSNTWPPNEGVCPSSESMSLSSPYSLSAYSSLSDDSCSEVDEAEAAEQSQLLQETDCSPRSQTTPNVLSKPVWRPW